MPLKIDLHVHTNYSCDATTTLEEVITYSKKLGLDGVAITDHDTLDGALKLIRETELIVVPGVEVTSLHGHILALNITTPIPPKLSIFETIQRIHEADGIAVAAHPTVVYKGGLRRRITSDFDAIEVINSTAFPFSFSTYLSRKLATSLKLPQTAGSDAHHACGIGSAYAIIDADPEIDEIVQAIKRGATIPLGKPLPWTMRLRFAALNLRRIGQRNGYSSKSSI